MVKHGTLSPSVIVDAAVAIAARAEPDGLTGRVIGEELGVDRSAVWRHFADRDALLLATGDRLLQMALDRVPDGLAAHERIMALARHVLSTFIAHPYVGALVACRTTRGPGEFAVVEFTLNAIRETGMPDHLVPTYQRMMADTVLAYAGMRAGYAVLPAAVRTGDEQAWMGAYATASAEDYPAIATHALGLAAVGDDQVFETLLQALWSAMETAIANADGE